MSFLASASRLFNLESSTSDFNAVPVPDDLSFGDWVVCREMLAQIYVARDSSRDSGLDLMRRICDQGVAPDVTPAERCALASVHYRLARTLAACEELPEAIARASSACELYTRAGMPLSFRGILAHLTLGTLQDTREPSVELIERQSNLLSLLQSKQLSDDQLIDRAIAAGDVHLRVFAHAHRAHYEFLDRTVDARELYATLGELHDAAYGARPRVHSPRLIPVSLPNAYLLAETRWNRLRDHCLKQALSSFHEAVEMIMTTRGPHHPSLVEALSGVVKVSAELSDRERLTQSAHQLGELQELFDRA